MQLVKISFNIISSFSDYLIDKQIMTDYSMRGWAENWLEVARTQKPEVTLVWNKFYVFSEYASFVQNKKSLYWLPLFP